MKGDGCWTPLICAKTPARALGQAVIELHGGGDCGAASVAGLFCVPAGGTGGDQKATGGAAQQL